MTNDDVLKFSSHDLSIFCYGGVSDVYVEYAHTGHDFFVGLVAPDKAPEDEARFPNSTSGSYVTFAGPVIVRWTARDGSKLDASIDLDPIFSDRAVLHSQDPGRIYQPAPIVGKSPTILVEVNDRCVSIYLLVTLKLVKEPEHNRFEIRENRTLAFSRSY